MSRAIFKGGPWDGVVIQTEYLPGAIAFRNLELKMREALCSHQSQRSNVCGPAHPGLCLERVVLVSDTSTMIGSSHSSGGMYHTPRSAVSAKQIKLCTYSFGSAGLVGQSH
jgi:hypothetical protein